MKIVLITGGTGLVGKYLSELLHEKGYQVRHLSRKRDLDAKFPAFQWDLNAMTADDDAFQNINFIIHLAGANISEGKWSDERKKVILESRTKSGELLLQKVKQLQIPLEKFISASATGFYGAITSDKIFTENDDSATDFVGKVCLEWENSSLKFEKNGFSTIILRTGIVLSLEGGALKKLIFPVKYGAGTAIGSGKQYMPWIHIEDLCHMYLAGIEKDEITGIFNATSTEHSTNKEFTKVLASILKRPFWPVNVPSFLLRTLFGEMSSIILEGSRVSSNKIIKTGFKFRFNTLKHALQNLV